MIKAKIPKELIEEWLNKLEKKLEKIRVEGEKGENLLKNIKAYIFDTKHFTAEGDYVKAWELISFAWGLFEAGEELEIIKNN
jgi:hypothetical protein